MGVIRTSGRRAENSPLGFDCRVVHLATFGLGVVDDLPQPVTLELPLDQRLHIGRQTASVGPRTRCRDRAFTWEDRDRSARFFAALRGFRQFYKMIAELETVSARIYPLGSV
ncbi:hypothetical protein [Nocardia sp. AG03]|uniref:hypothetical protein n=1 Tax=Nocardia sp. AG03 TaxID=3025312 RepID=UPI002418A657|nr:hypothetical protein [Nocardia sp. AG03]